MLTPKLKKELIKDLSVLSQNDILEKYRITRNYYRDIKKEFGITCRKKNVWSKQYQV